MRALIGNDAESMRNTFGLLLHVCVCLASRERNVGMGWGVSVDFNNGTCDR